MLCNRFILQMGNHDQKRVSSRYGPARTDVINILLKTLPGISITYYVSIFISILFFFGVQ